jgi:hypothetical protein
VSLDDLLADRQADTGAWILALDMQALEDHEDAVGILTFDADTIVRHSYEAVVFAVLLCRNPDVWRTILAELDCIGDEVLEQLR